MFYSIVSRIFRKHALFHLLIPLSAGVLVEALYAHYFGDVVTWADLPVHLLSGQRLALYAGIFAAYVVVVGLLIKSETTVGLRRLDFGNLPLKLQGTKSLFAVAPTPFEEWFDPAAQVYLATIYAERLNAQPFRYERVVLLPYPSAKRNIKTPFLDGYYARCLVDIHRLMSINLYVLDWNSIETVIRQLSPEERVLIGYYPKIIGRFPKLAPLLMWPLRRRRVRRIAGGVVEGADEQEWAFRFAKRENVVEVEVHPKERSHAYIRFVDLLKQEIYEDPTNRVARFDNHLANCL